MSENILEVPEDLDLSPGESEEEIQIKEVEEVENREEQPVETEEDDIVLTLGEDEEDDETSQKTPQWVKDTRKEIRQLRKENKQLQRQLTGTGEQEVDELGPEPTLEQYNHDDVEFKAAYRDWIKKSDDIEKSKSEKKAREEQKEAEWNQKLTNHQKNVQELNLPEFEDYSDIVSNSLEIHQQGIIIETGDASARITAVLGQNPKTLEKLAKIKDPVLFAIAIGELKAKMKVNNRKPKPNPEKKLVGNASLSTGGKEYDKLIEQATKDGDVKKIMEYKRKRKLARSG